MTRTFTFSSDNSSKFWTIKTTDNAFTVSYGRTGTTGQSQTKTFDSADRAQQEADKLIREKTAKGYLETMNGQPVATPTKPTAKPVSDDKLELENILNRYDEIIRNSLVDELLPFLKGIDKRWYKALGERAASTKHPPALQVGLLKNAGIARQKLTPMAQINQNLTLGAPLCGLRPPDT